MISVIWVVCEEIAASSTGPMPDPMKVTNDEPRTQRPT